MYSSSYNGYPKGKDPGSSTEFSKLEHRMEPVATIRGVEFINDSKATNVNSTWYALESMTKPTILILGGVDKGNDYSLIEELVKEKVKAIICLGTDNRKIHEAFGNMVSTDCEYRQRRGSRTGCLSFCRQRRCGIVKPGLCKF